VWHVRYIVSRLRNVLHEFGYVGDIDAGKRDAC
jgi:hypothetical protein